VAATAPVAAKPTSKTTASETDSSTPDASATDSSTAAAQNSLVQQPASTGKPDAANAAVDAVATEAAAGASSSSAGAITAHEHTSADAAAHAPTDASDTGVQAAGIIQPQPATPAATSAATLTATAATNAPVPLSGLAVEIAASVKSGKSSFEIRLDPADLGRIDVRIDIDRNGQVTSHLTVEKPETLSMLRQDAPQLQRALDDAGLKTGNNGLQFSLRDQSSSGQNNGGNTGGNAHRLIVSDAETTPAAIAGRSYGRSLGSSSGVDIRV
jgi:flagellar hook-length control protein FliK